MNNSQSLAKTNRDRQISPSQISTSISLENVQTIKSSPIKVAIADWQIIKRHDPAAKNWLGNIRIGDRVRIGAGSVILRDVPSDCTVVGIPGRIIRTNEQAISLNTDRENLPDLEAEVISKLFEKIKVLEQQVQSLNSQLHPAIEGKIEEISPSQDVSEADKAIEDFLYGAGI
jgi:acyl-[acyl carrier protein]--UDP-N-acetylglucosamine O-acyltransferase